jgi:hypothetical protein
MDQDIIDFQNDNLIKNGDLVKLENMLKSMTDIVAEQKAYLDKHTAAMEKLTQAVKQLDQTLKKEISHESRQSSSELEELIKLFVEYDINPQFYHEYKMLKAASVPKQTQLVRRKNNRRPNKEG